MSTLQKTKKYTPPKNLDISIVDLGDLGLHQRLDAEYYLPESLEIEKNILLKPYKRVGEILDFLTDYTSNGSFASLRNNVSVSDSVDFAKWIRIKNLDEKDFDKGVRYVDEKSYNFLKKTKLFGGEILISKTGEYLGKAYKFSNINYKATLADNIFLLRLKDINEDYFVTYINSDIGQNFIERLSQGGGQPTIIKNSLRDILIPIPPQQFQQKIADMVQEAHSKREESKKLYKESEEILLSELGLKDYKPTNKNIAIHELEEVKKYGRMDAEFFQPKYNEIIEKIDNIESKILGDIVDYKKGVEPGSGAYVKDGVPFARVSDFSINGFEDIKKKVSQEFFEKTKGEYSPKKDELLFTKDGTIGITGVINEDLNIVLSGAFLRLVKKEKIESEYLALVLNSIISKLQIERFSGGAIIAHLKPSDAMNLKIPILSEKIQKEISKKIVQSHELRKESKDLLEKAKRMVEEEIEK
ncbi:restriction endonuclease subunit S [Patescibacteria group bacterium]